MIVNEEISGTSERIIFMWKQKKHSSFRGILIFVNLACYHGIAALHVPTPLLEMNLFACFYP